MNNPVEKNGPVAWRVKDFGDGWIIFGTKFAADREASHSGAMVEAIYSASTVEALKAENAALLSRVERLEQALEEALTTQENDRTLWTPEWQIWAHDARAALQEKKP